MFRKSWFWIGLVALSILGALFSYHFFDKAFPIVNLDLKMDRAFALSSAGQLDAKFQWAPTGFRQAASFDLDNTVQNFVELEAGGKPAFASMISGGLYSPYVWTVRHFKEAETREVRIKFTPLGTPYGFDLKLPEKEAGAALSAQAAQTIAENSARGDWGIDLSKYQLVEKSQEVRPGKRIDHTFVYERPGVQIGQGRYRLKLVVGGEKLTELTHFVKVPEAFSRRYEAMRSSNTAISVASVMGMVVLYVIGGCGIGLFFLLRERRVIWMKPVFWGLSIGLLQVLAGFNEWPLLWMGYDTALSTGNFTLNRVVEIVAGSLGMGCLLAISFMAAESLSRKAFPHHIQLWRLWAKPAAASPAVLGRTVGGYLLLPLFLAYVIAFYFVASRVFHWWTPSDVLLDPNILATYFPWISSIAASAQAGFWEESLFRAVPLACAALLGNRWGRRGWWIAGAMVLQALVFGAGHAGYANQPAYARVVELIVPSLGFGGLYLTFGLLPAVILHYAFDVLMISLPLFISVAPGIWIDRILVILLLLIPFWVVLAARLRQKKWQEIPSELFNASWEPSAPRSWPIVESTRSLEGPKPALRFILPGIGVAGLALWLGLSLFQTDSPSVMINRSTAEKLARQILRERNIQLDAPWKVLSSVDGQPDEADRFLWQTAGRETYHRLMGQYIDPPVWNVRFARFEGDVAGRAEEYFIDIDGQGELYRFQHKLPESRPGRSLQEEEARDLAKEGLQKIFHLDSSVLREISAVPSKLKERTDWSFTFADSARTPLPQGEARIQIQIAGDEVTNAYRFIYVPEEWARQQRDRRNLPNLVEYASLAMMGLIIVGGTVAGIISWSRKKFSSSTFFLAGGFLFLLALTNALNRMPAVMADFSTARPFVLQIYIVIAASLVGLLVMSLCLALIAGFVRLWSASATALSSFELWIYGIALGAFWPGLSALAWRFRPDNSPNWANFSALNHYLPLWERFGTTLWRFLLESLVVLFLFTMVDRVTCGWGKRKIPGAIILMVFGLVVAGTGNVETIPSWLITGLLMGLFFLSSYALVLRFNLWIIPAALCAADILSLLRQGWQQPYAAALAHNLVAAAVLGLVAWYWQRRNQRDLNPEKQGAIQGPGEGSD